MQAPEVPRSRSIAVTDELPIPDRPRSIPHGRSESRKLLELGARRVDRLGDDEPFSKAPMPSCETPLDTAKSTTTM
jgi:hypothetical protein